MPGPSKSRIEELDLYAEDYAVKNAYGETVYAPAPAVKLSFEEATDNAYFTEKAIMSDAFSSAIQHMYKEEKPNVLTTFVPMGRGWDDVRSIPIKFVKTNEPCVNMKLIRNPEVYDAPEKYLYGLHRKIGSGRVDPKLQVYRLLETVAINTTAKYIPFSTRQVTLLHWVCNWPGLWVGTKVLDTFYAAQWVDTHSHPAWYYPHSAKIKGLQILLRIRVRKGTPMLRIKRHSSSEKRIDLLKSGQWTYRDVDPHETEVRLPPGKYTVETPPTVERYANKNVLFVSLVYEPWHFLDCKTLVGRFTARS